MAEQLRLNGSGTWLDIGCGSRPYEALFNVEQFIGLDVIESGRPTDLKLPDVLFDGIRFPICNESIDGILCTQVLEHVTSPENLLMEMARILKPGGKLILTAPFLWEEHEVPYDFYRFSHYGLKRLLESQGFQITALDKTTGTIEALAQASSIFLINNIRLPLPGFGRLLTLLLCAPIQILGIVFQKVLPDRRDLYLDNVVLAYKPTERELPN